MKVKPEKTFRDEFEAISALMVACDELEMNIDHVRWLVGTDDVDRKSFYPVVIRADYVNQIGRLIPRADWQSHGITLVGNSRKTWT